IIFTCCCPIYISTMHSGLTEPLFSAALILCIWLILSEKYYASAVLLSFMPFIRPEFAFIVPIFILYYLIKRKYLAIPLMGCGIVLVTIIGYLHYKNFAWLIQHNTYKIAGAEVQKGDFFYYIKSYKQITGLALAILISGGFINLFISKKLSNNIVTNYKIEEGLLVYGSLFMVWACHSLS